MTLHKPDHLGDFDRYELVETLQITDHDWALILQALGAYQHHTDYRNLYRRLGRVLGELAKPEDRTRERLVCRMLHPVERL